MTRKDNGGHAVAGFELIGKKILVTGGTGSFGRKFIEIALRTLQPKGLIVFSRDELKQHDRAQQYRDEARLRFFLGDVRDKPCGSCSTIRYMACPRSVCWMTIAGSTGSVSKPLSRSMQR